MKVISFSNFKGGVGKSSSSLCVAYSLVNRGYRVLLIDADSQANLSLSLGLDKNSDLHIGNFILGEKSFDQVAKKINSLLQIIPSSLKVQVYEKMLSAENEYQYFLKERLEDISSFDYLIIDTPPALNSFTFASLVATDYLFIPAQPEIFGVEGLTTILDTVERLKKRSNKNLRIGGIFFTKYAKSYRKRIHHDLVDGLKENYGNLIMNTTIRDNVSIAESQALKESIYNYAPQSNGAKDYDELTSEILKRIN
ncbi:ParA family protein [Adhaeribacter pallidiroseus]|uniref:Chromosome partitioning protein ParA n=1 Tax=Adhaeribacter pallidiroseus TaxID=2072847 RepID=A0A369Q956_9BACT|nr:ParA family protein [Adhaeribacter pallidiroseus]RDC58818.1 Chromosome partitioning protein ParA [Adhaeribacter pallidiroseus]